MTIISEQQVSIAMSSTIDSATTEIHTPSPFVTILDVEITKYEDAIKAARESIKALKNLKKAYAKDVKALEKEVAKKTKREPSLAKRNNNGFTNPCAISAELATFMNQDKDLLISRTDVTKWITTYIKDNELLVPDNRRVINYNKDTDAGRALKKLLSPIDEGQEISWFNLQTYLKRHYPKKATTEVAAPVAKVAAPVAKVATPVAKVAAPVAKVAAPVANAVPTIVPLGTYPVTKHPDSSVTPAKRKVVTAKARRAKVKTSGKA
jgi:chromatin remodeling complex protein RSC6